MKVNEEVKPEENGSGKVSSLLDCYVPTLLHGDCLDLMKSMPDNSVDCVVTDPPYFVPATHYNVRSGSFRSLSDLGILEHFFYSVAKGLDKILTPDGHTFVFCDGQSYPLIYSTMYPFFKSLRPLVWDKKVSFNGYGWRHQHELILFCQRPEAKPIKTGDGDILRCRAVPIKSRRHLAEKPVELLELLIKKCNPTIVFDPFMGSAATGEAAINVGCKFIGCEKDPNYFNISTKRISAA